MDRYGARSEAADMCAQKKRPDQRRGVPSLRTSHIKQNKEVAALPSASAKRITGSHGEIRVGYVYIIPHISRSVKGYPKISYNFHRIVKIAPGQIRHRRRGTRGAQAPR